MKPGKRLFLIVVAMLMVLSIAVAVPCHSYAEDQNSSEEVSKVLIAKAVSKGSSDLVISWNRVDKADGYDVDIFRCRDGALQKVASRTFKGNKTFKWTKKKLKKQTSYKVIVCAWMMNGGVKTPLKTDPFPRPRLHVYTSGGSKKYTNPKSITLSDNRVSLNENESYWIKAKVNKLRKGKKLIDHEAKIRYFSTDTSIAKVNTAGKIEAVSKGSCKIYVYAVNGVKKTINVTVNSL